MRPRTKKTALAVVALAGVGVILTGCDMSNGNTSASTAEQTNENITGQIESSASKAVPYPLQQMQAGGWTEEQLLKEHLLRENDPNAVRYVVVVAPFTGQVISNYTIKGMVFDPNSSMTETNDVVCNTGDTSSAYSCGVVQSPSDNGTYGPEAMCYAFFLASSGGEVQLPCNGPAPIESDVPLNYTTQPLITYNANQAPSSNFGGVSKIGGK